MAKHWPAVFGWAVSVALVVAGLALFEGQSLRNELQTESAILHRLASQRADQHDAHLTSLSAVAVAAQPERQDLFLDVAATILRFYPRIAAIDLVPLSGPENYLSTRPAIEERTIAAIRLAARASEGALVLRSSPEAANRYLLVKRSPNSDEARFGLALEIDAADLVVSESAFWQRPSVSRSLKLPDGTLLTGDDIYTGAQFRKPLGSATQPLILEAGISPGPADLLPAGRAIIAMVLTSLFYWAGVLGVRQLARARKAERQARISAQEARLAHASRVNALGEMASGMAHELTQPLTAILSQAQAGQHLMRRGETDALGPVLDDTVAQARRASAILNRLRRWIRPTPVSSSTGSLNDAVRNVYALLHPEAERAGIALNLKCDPQPLQIHADQVELEQVIFNLVRNAMDALAGAEKGRVTILTRSEKSFAVVEVADTGPGVPEAIRSRLFEPFVTGRSDGTGLGLALCQRLVDRMEGDIALADGTPETIFRIRLPLAVKAASQAAE